MQHQARTRRGAVALLLILAMLTVTVAAFVPFVASAEEEEFRDFGYQAPVDYSMIDANSNLRFVCTVPASKLAGYTAAGFVFSKTVSTPSVGADGCATAYASAVYSSIVADGKTYNADTGRFWLAVKLTNIPRSYFDGPIYVRAFATDGEGTRYSDAKMISVWSANAIEIVSDWDESTRTAYNTANGVNWLNSVDISSGINIMKNINDIKSASQHYYPDASNNYEGNDLLVEVSFLWNETLATKYTWQQLTFAHVDGYDLFNVGSVITPKERGGYTYEFLYPTEGSHTPSIGEYGWHRLGFRVHQDAEIVDAAVKYTYVASVYVDGELKVSFDATDYVVRRNPTGTVTALLYTAQNVGGKLVYYDIGSDPKSTYKTSYGVLMFEEFFTKAGGYCVLSDLSMTCGQTFVQQVTSVADPAAKEYLPTDGSSAFTAKVYYTTADPHEHVWDGNYVVTKPATLMENGLKVEHCSVCGEARTVSAVYEAPTVYDASTKNSGEFSIMQRTRDLRNGQHYYPDASNNGLGNDVLVEFSFLYSEYNKQAGIMTTDSTLTVMFVEDYNIFNINLRAGTVQLRARSGITAVPSGTVSIGEYGWHRFGVRFHSEAVNESETVVFTVTATAYLDGVEIIVADLTSWVNSLSSVVNGRIFKATADGNGGLTYQDETSKTCDVYIKCEEFYNNANGKLVLTDVSMTCGRDFVQQVEPAETPIAAAIDLGDFDPAVVHYQPNP